jgi:hypothetical protein
MGSLTESRECAHRLLSKVRCLKRKPAARHAMAASALSATDTHTSNFAQSNVSTATSPRQSNRLPVSNNGSTFLETIACRPTQVSRRFMVCRQLVVVPAGHAASRGRLSTAERRKSPLCAPQGSLQRLLNLTCFGSMTATSAPQAH